MHSYVHLSAGELLRQERESGSKDGKLIDEYIREGRIVPVAISLGLLQRAMKASGPFSRFLIDGFPRNSDNFQASSPSPIQLRSPHSAVDGARPRTTPKSRSGLLLWIKTVESKRLPSHHVDGGDTVLHVPTNSVCDEDPDCIGHSFARRRTVVACRDCAWSCMGVW